MGTDVVIVVPPLLGNDLRFLEGVKYLPVEQLIA